MAVHLNRKTLYPIHPKETHMPYKYKTIVLELLEQQTELHERLRITRRLLPTLEDLGQGTQDQPRSLEGNPLAGEAGERRHPDQQRSLGDGSQGTGGAYALRVSAGRERNARQSDGTRAKSHAVRLAPPGNRRACSTPFQITRCRRHPCPCRVHPPTLRRSRPSARRSRPDAVRYFCQRRKGKSPRHPRCHPHTEGRRTSGQAGDAGRKAGACPIRRLWSCGLIHFPRPG